MFNWICFFYFYSLQCVLIFLWWSRIIDQKGKTIKQKTSCRLIKLLLLLFCVCIYLDGDRLVGVLALTNFFFFFIVKPYWSTFVSVKKVHQKHNKNISTTLHKKLVCPQTRILSIKLSLLLNIKIYTKDWWKSTTPEKKSTEYKHSLVKNKYHLAWAVMFPRCNVPGNCFKKPRLLLTFPGFHSVIV